VSQEKQLASPDTEVIQEIKEVEKELHEFEAKESSVTRTLQIIVYPALVAFIILAAYGFYLVQSLTMDVKRLTETIANMNTDIHDNLGAMTGTMSKMSDHMQQMVNSTDSMSLTLQNMYRNTLQMSGDMAQMNISTYNMAHSFAYVQRDMWSMNRTVSNPMRMMTSFIPFFGSSDSPPPVASPLLMPYYGIQPWGYLPPSVPPQAPASLPANTP